MPTGSRTVGGGQLRKLWVVDQCISSGKTVRLLACTVLSARCELAERSVGRSVAQCARSRATSSISGTRHSHNLHIARQILVGADS